MNSKQNKELIKEQNHIWYLKNKDKVKAATKQYKIDHPDAYKNCPSYKKKLTGERISLRVLSDEEREVRRKELHKQYLKDHPDKYERSKILRPGNKKFDRWLSSL